MQREWAIPEEFMEDVEYVESAAGKRMRVGEGSSSRPTSRSSTPAGAGRAASASRSGGQGAGGATAPVQRNRGSNVDSDDEGDGIQVVESSPVSHSSSTRARNGAGVRSTGSVGGVGSMSQGGPGHALPRLLPPHPLASEEEPLHLRFDQDGHITPSSKSGIRSWAGKRGGRSTAQVRHGHASLNEQRAEPPAGKQGRLFKMSAAPGGHAYTGLSPTAEGSGSGARAGSKRTSRARELW